MFAVAWAALLTLLAGPSYAINPPSRERRPIRPIPGTKSEISAETAWRQLLPLDERDHFSMIAPPPLHDYLSGQMAASQTGSAAVNPKLEGVTIRLPGFVVPITFIASGSVGEFLLVPYAGACLSRAATPPNQTIFIELDKAMQLTALYECLLDYRHFARAHAWQSFRRGGLCHER